MKKKFQHTGTELTPPRYTKHSTPFFADECCHGHECYIGSAVLHSYLDEEHDHLDVYLFDDKYCVNKVCIRFGDEGGDYFSTGTIFDLIHTIGSAKNYANPAYLVALDVINQHLTFKGMPE